MRSFFCRGSPINGTSSSGLSGVSSQTSNPGSRLSKRKFERITQSEPLNKLKLKIPSSVSRTENDTFCTDQTTQIEEPKLKKRKMNEIDKQEYLTSSVSPTTYFGASLTKNTLTPNLVPEYATTGLIHTFSSLSITNPSTVSSLEEQSTIRILRLSSFQTAQPLLQNVPICEFVQLSVLQQLDYIVYCLRVV
jgi:hypothetical protein